MGIYVLRQKMANKSVRRHSRKTAAALSNDETAFERIKNSFDTLILSLPVGAGAQFRQPNAADIFSSNPKFPETYRISGIQAGDEHNFILMADATGKDLVPSRRANNYVDVVYSCNMYGILRMLELPWKINIVLILQVGIYQ